MSFLVKAVLGQKVVHPPPSTPVEHVEKVQPRSTSDPAHTSPTDSVVPRTIRNTGGDCNGNMLRDDLEKKANSVQPHKIRVNRSQAPPRTLLLRIQTCTVAQDRRDALRDLEACADLPYVMGATEVAYLIGLLRNFSDDEDVVDAALGILVNITDVSTYPSGDTDGYHAITAREKKSIRDSFLHALLQEFPSLLTFVKEGPFWVRHHAVQLLQRLQDFDPPAVHRDLFASHGVTILVDLLNCKVNNGALRNEGLVLLKSVTSMEPEMQTVLAFNSGFESLLNMIEEVGDSDDGVVVSNCLTIIQNMLRGNRATSKLFIELSCARRLKPLLEKASSMLDSCEADQKRGLTNPFIAMSNTHSLVVFLAVTIFSSLLKESEGAGDALYIADGLLRCGLLSPLSSLALCGRGVDDGTRIEALRTLALLLRSQERAVNEFLGLGVVTLLVIDSSPQQLVRWSATRAILQDLLLSDDRTMQLAAVQVMQSLLSVPTCQTHVLRALLNGLGQPGKARLLGNGIWCTDCGAFFGLALLGSLPAATGKYYAAHLLNLLLTLPSVAELLVTWSWKQKSSSGTASSPLALTSCPMVTLSSAVPPCFFNAYVSYVLFCIQGGHSNQGMDSAALSAYTQALFTWFRCAPSSVNYFVSDAHWYKSLLHRAAQSCPVNIRFWCAALAANICCVLPAVLPLPAARSTRSGGSENRRQGMAFPEPKPVMEGNQFLELFINQLGGSFFFDNLLIDVSASTPQWSQPPSRAFTAAMPALYDVAFVEQLSAVMTDFRALCSSRPTIHTENCESLQEHAALFHPAEGNRSLFREADIGERVDAVTTQEARNGASPNAPNNFIHTGACNSTVLALSRPQEVAEVPVRADGSRPHREFPSNTLSPTLLHKGYGTAVASVENGDGLVSSERVEVIDEVKSFDDVSHAQEWAAQANGHSEHWETVCQEQAEAIRCLQVRQKELEEEVALWKKEAASRSEIHATETRDAEEKHASEAADLREHIHILEEALRAKEEEQEQLVQSMGMMEMQLAQFNRSVGDAVAGNAERLAGVLEERDELLLLVAELDDERASLRGTPAKRTLENGICVNSAEDGPLLPSFMGHVPATSATAIQAIQSKATGHYEEQPLLSVSPLPCTAPEGYRESCAAPVAEESHHTATLPAAVVKDQQVVGSVPGPTSIERTACPPPETVFPSVPLPPVLMEQMIFSTPIDVPKGYVQSTDSFSFPFTSGGHNPTFHPSTFINPFADIPDEDHAPCSIGAASSVSLPDDAPPVAHADPSSQLENFVLTGETGTPGHVMSAVHAEASSVPQAMHNPFADVSGYGCNSGDDLR